MLKKVTLTNSSICHRFVTILYKSKIHIIIVGLTHLSCTLYLFILKQKGGSGLSPFKMETEFTDEEILNDLRRTYELIKEERKHKYPDMSPMKLLYTISQEDYQKSIEYYKESKFDIANLHYELAQLKQHIYLKQSTALKTKNKNTSAKQS